MSLGVPAQEIRRQGFQSNQMFADCLEWGASFPALRYSLSTRKDPKPLWFDSWNEDTEKGPRTPRHIMPPWTDYEDEPQPPAPSPAVKVPLPLEPQNVPPAPRTGGGGGRGGR